ncbi:MAG: hypothetical protein ACLGG7_01995 [Bacteriovoracia bacterium]
MKLWIALLLTLSFIAPKQVWAQAASEDDIVANTQNDLMLVAGAGVGGAVLGLSTLSFYDKPSKSIANIWTGAAVGIIVGVIVVAMSHAQKSQEQLSYEMKPQKDFSTFERESWHMAHSGQVNMQSLSPSAPLWGMSF